jgi:hypothetical protein
MKLHLWEQRRRTTAHASLTGVASDEPAGDIPAAVPSAAGSGVDHADSEPSTATDNDECCALLRGDPGRRSPFRLRQRRNAPEH